MQWIPKRCKGVHCVDLGESFPTGIYLQNLASIQPRTSLVKFARSPRIIIITDRPGLRHANGRGLAAGGETWIVEASAGGVVETSAGGETWIVETSTGGETWLVETSAAAASA